MIIRFKNGEYHKKLLQSLNINPKDLIDNNHDYSNEIIEKPWGYEYQLFANSELAIWILHINENQCTSYHCHPNKKTALILLSNTKVMCRSGVLTEFLSKDDILIIYEGVFHQTTAFNNSVIIMEIETPTNKKDLVRFQDSYGRV